MLAEGTKKKSQRLLWVSVAILVLLWAIASGLRYMSMDSELAALGDSFWDVKIEVQIRDPVDAGVVALAAVPADTAYIRLVGQHLTHPGWRLRFTTDPEWGSGRLMRLVSTSVTSRGFVLGFTVRQSDTPHIQTLSLGQRPSAKILERYLRNESRLDLENTIITNEISQLSQRSTSNTDLLTLIFDRTRQLVLRDKPSTIRTIPNVLISGQATVLERSYAMVALCRTAHIPARLVTGLELTVNNMPHLHHWVEAYISGKGWLAYDPLHGYQKELPSNFLPFVKGRSDLVEVESTGNITVKYLVTEADQSLAFNNNRENDWKSIFYLTRLPLESRNVLAHLLLLPLAVLITTLFRSLTGVISYGTFTPALFALSWVYADWRMVAITMFLVFLFGLLGRSALPAKLNRQPRLTIVLILVVVAISGTVSLMDYLHWHHDEKVSLLPVIIMSMLIDRFYKALEKEGPLDALVKLGWTLFQVLLCLPLMHLDWLGHWLVAHPEAHLLTLAVTLAVTTYRGKKLVNLLKSRTTTP